MSITKKFSLLWAAATAVSLTACVVKDDGPGAKIDRSIPTNDQVAIKLPQGGNRTVGQLADFYVQTRNITTMFNGGSAWVLILIHTIVQYPVTSADANTYTWGPFDDGALASAEYKLDVTDNGNESYTWALSGRSKLDANAQFEMIIEGLADSSAGEAQGNGEFTIDFDAGKRVNPVDANPNDRGTVGVHYDLAARHLDLHIDSTTDAGAPVKGDYVYQEAADGSGEMGFGAQGDFGGGPALEAVLIHSRWLATGSGRADVAMDGGDTQTKVLASECWDTQFKRSFFAVLAGDPNGVFGAAEGNEASCAYSDAQMPGQ